MTALLSISDVSSGYDHVLALQNADLHVNEGEVVCILGANGAGKTTLLLTIARHLKLRSGRIVFDGEDVGALAADQMAQRRLSLVLEGGRLFPFMTVLENLQLGAFHAEARKRMRESMDEIMDIFPILEQRKDQLAGRLSGGERQMVAIARGMMSLPKLLMLDEPSLGLSPLMIDKIFDIVTTLAGRGVTILLVEQNVHDALAVCTRGYVMENGRIVNNGTGAELLGNAQIQKAYLGL
jgi:branched-chain amino acid transport system ATP-binding protein